MNSYVITYDLCEPGKNYEELIENIKKYSYWGKLNKSSCLVKTDSNSTEIRQNLRTYLDSNDKLFVAKLTGQAAWTKCDCSDEWLKARLESK